MSKGKSATSGRRRAPENLQARKKLHRWVGITNVMEVTEKSADWAQSGPALEAVPDG
jgi:hypothetical protein